MRGTLFLCTAARAQLRWNRACDCSIDCQVIKNDKAQKSMKSIVSIVHMLSVVQSEMFEATRIHLYAKKTKNNNLSTECKLRKLFCLSRNKIKRFLRVFTRGVTVHKIHGSVRYNTVVSRFSMFSIAGVGKLVTSQCWKYLCFKPWRRANGYHTSTHLHHLCWWTS